MTGPALLDPEQESTMRDYVLTQALSYDRSGPFPVLRRLYSNWRKRRRLTDLQQLDDRIL